MATSVPTTDALRDKLSLTELGKFAATSATTTTATAKNLGGAGPMPLSLAAMLCGAVIAASHTLDVTIEGSNDNFATAGVVVGTFAQLTNANQGTAQRLSLSGVYQYYRAVAVSAGAFGASEVLRATVVLVGTDLRNVTYTAV